MTIQSVKIFMSRKEDVLSNISGIKCGEELFYLRIVRFVKMKVKIISD